MSFELLGYVDDGVNPAYWTSLKSPVVNDVTIPWWTRNNNVTPTAEERLRREGVKF